MKMRTTIWDYVHDKQYLTSRLHWKIDAKKNSRMSSQVKVEPPCQAIFSSYSRGEDHNIHDLQMKTVKRCHSAFFFLVDWTTKTQDWVFWGLWVWMHIIWLKDDHTKCYKIELSHASRRWLGDVTWSRRQRRVASHGTIQWYSVKRDQ